MSLDDGETRVDLSIVICTYNRAALLAQALETLVVQHGILPSYEILVIDNNSSDDTSGVTEQYAARGPVRRVLETKQGLSHARNRGWQEARGRYVAYVDDDCKMPHEWLSIAGEVAARVAPAVYGGPYYACYESDKPRWYKNEYGSHVQGDAARGLGPNEYLDGGNIVFRRDLLAAINGFHPELGMNGEALGYGEETAILRQIRSRWPDETIYYEPRLYVHHLVRPEKMRLRWALRHAFVDGQFCYRIFKPRSVLQMDRRQLRRQAASAAWSFVRDVAGGLVRADRERYPYFQNYLYEQAFRHVQRLGILYERRRAMTSTADSGA